MQSQELFDLSHLLPGRKASVMCEVEDGAAWVFAMVSGPSGIREGGRDGIHWTPRGGWAWRQVDPRGDWPHFAKMDRTAAAGAIFLQVSAVLDVQENKVLVEGLCAVMDELIRTMEAAVVMGS